jgi:hypothetical protein
LTRELLKDGSGDDDSFNFLRSKYDLEVVNGHVRRDGRIIDTGALTSRNFVPPPLVLKAGVFFSDISFSNGACTKMVGFHATPSLARLLKRGILHCVPGLW